MRDAPRSEVREAVQLCQQAGIRITIVTGDNGLTAAAIGREIGIADEDTPIFTGEQLRKMSSRELKKILRQKQNLIFARVQPADKLRIVESYKKIQEVVAVTGDGVNDAPALKCADIGVAMGRTGSDVAKEAANLVLTDDSFASIITAVAEGRRIYANQTIHTQMEILLKDKTNTNFTKADGLAPGAVMNFKGVPIRMDDTLLITEAALS